MTHSDRSRASFEVVSTKRRIGEFITFLLFLATILYVFSLTACFYTVPTHLPRFIFSEVPRKGANLDWWSRTLIDAHALWIGKKMHILPPRARYAPAIILGIDFFWAFVIPWWQRRREARTRPVDPLLAQMRCLAKTQDFALLDETCQQIILSHQFAISPKERLEVFKIQAIVKLRRGQGLEAIQYHQRVLTLEPGNPEFQVGLLRSYQMTERTLPAAALDLLMTVMKDVRPLPRDIVLFYVEQSLKSAGRAGTSQTLSPPDEFIHTLPSRDSVATEIRSALPKMAESGDPLRSRAILCLARLALKEKAHKVAVQHLRTVLEEDGTLAEAYSMVLEAFRGANDLESLAQLYESLRLKYPRESSLQKAIEKFHEEEPKAASLGPSAIKEVDLNDLPRAAGSPLDFDSSSEKEFEDALAMLSEGRGQIARALLERLERKKFPKRDELNTALVWCNLLVSDVETAQKYSAKVDWGRVDPPVIFSVARLAESMRQTSWARDLYVRILEQAPDHNEARVRLSVVEKKMSQTKA